MVLFIALLSVLVALERLWTTERRQRTRGGVDPSSTRRRAILALVAIAGGVGCVMAAPPGPVLAKCVGRLAMPAGLLWTGLLVAALVTLRTRHRTAAVCLAVAWLAVTAAGNEAFGATLLARLESPFVDRDPFEEAPFDAVFVMGGGVADDPRGRPQVGPSGDRAILAARLYRAGIARRLVASGTSVPGLGRSKDVGALTATLWTSLGVSAGSIERTPPAYNSRQEVAAYAARTAEAGWTRVGLLTSAWHLRRAMRLAARQPGFTPVPLAADVRGRPRWEGFYSLIPSGGGFADVATACWEWLGAATGR